MPFVETLLVNLVLRVWQAVCPAVMAKITALRSIAEPLIDICSTCRDLHSRNSRFPVSILKDPDSF